MPVLLGARADDWSMDEHVANGMTDQPDAFPDGGAHSHPDLFPLVPFRYRRGEPIREQQPGHCNVESDSADAMKRPEMHPPMLKTETTAAPPFPRTSRLSQPRLHE